MRRFFALMIMALCCLVPVTAQDALAPDELTGQAVYVAFPVSITPDGDLALHHSG
ncbi:MAG: hypothetical protein MUF38_13650 [Anaerolineae bacterium]|nr:hypothetical protein [Anaerolineae bacterium]